MQEVYMPSSKSGTTRRRGQIRHRQKRREEALKTRIKIAKSVKKASIEA